VSGGLEPRDVRRLLARLDEGFVDGTTREIVSAKIATHATEPFRAFPAKFRASVLIVTRPLRFQSDFARAKERAKSGEIVTLISLSPDARYHAVGFDPAGVWMQKGGLFGKSVRSEPLFHMTTRSRRVEKERQRVARQRGLSKD
jgi:hypothetical protein